MLPDREAGARAGIDSITGKYAGIPAMLLSHLSAAVFPGILSTQSDWNKHLFPRQKLTSLITPRIEPFFYQTFHKCVCKRLFEDNIGSDSRLPSQRNSKDLRSLPERRPLRTESMSKFSRDLNNRCRTEFFLLRLLMVERRACRKCFGAEGDVPGIRGNLTGGKRLKQKW